MQRVARRLGADPGQRFPFTIPPPGATGIWGKYLPIATAPTYRVDNKLPYSEQFNLTIQREIARTTVLTVGYVGSRGRHLLNEVELNPGNAAKCDSRQCEYGLDLEASWLITEAAQMFPT